MFARIDLVKHFRPRQDSKIYGLDRLIDMHQYPRARAITFYAIMDSAVNNAITVKVVGSDSPDPGGGIVDLGEDQQSTPNKYSKLAFSINMAVAPFPFYGLAFGTGAAAPNAGECWGYADVWWPED